MAGMNNDYLDLIAAAGANAITHIGLVDASGNELSGGSPAYARQAVTWTSPDDGTIRPDVNLEFDVPASTTVGGWRGYSAGSGGTNYGGKDLDNETFTNQGIYRLLAASTAIHHTAED